MTLKFNNYKIGGGEITNGKFTYSFDWKNNLKMSYSTWNSFCVTFQSANLNFAINGKLILNLTEEKQKEYDKIDVSRIALGDKLFSGQISEFNLWSRGLSVEEIQQFSIGCDSNFEEKSKPVFGWSSTNFSIQGSYVVALPFPREPFCQEKTDLNHQTKLFLFPNYLKYDYCRDKCDAINGNIFYPKNENNFQYLLKSVGSSLVAENCRKGFWVPFIRSTKNESTWIHDRESNQDEEDLLSPWMKDILEMSNVPKECMYFDLSSKKLKEVECSLQSFCTFCEIDDSKIIFNLQSKRDFGGKLDTSYFIMPRMAEGYYLSGILGLTNIKATEIYSTWQIQNVGKSNVSEKVVADVESNDPLGIKNWILKPDNVTFQTKISNVSSKRN